MSDQELINVILGPDRDLSELARKIYNNRHKDDVKPPEPKHCPGCFEGCEKCNWGRF